MKFTSDNENFKFFEIPVPDEIDMKPTYETACQLFSNNSKSVLKNLSQSFLMDKSKWILPIFKLHTDEDETMFRRTKTLPSSKLDELFIHEVNKYKKRNEKVENISVDNFNEKYEKTLAELKNEEKIFNKLKQKLIICQYKSNEVPLWNTGNDMIINNDSSDYELLNNCEEKINLLKLNLMNLINTSPVCSIYETGKEMCDHKLNSIRNTIQQRFLLVWNKLKLTESEKQSCLLKFCWQHLSDTIYMANINKALNLLEYAAKYIERREMLLHKLAKIEIEHLIQSKDYSLNDNHLELKCSDERYKVDKKFNKLEKLIESTAKQLEKKFNYTLTFNGQIYLKKMVHDRSDLIYLLREKYKRYICGCTVQRTNYGSHYQLHSNVQAQLDGWIELRCPLSFLGCKYAVVNLRPNSEYNHLLYNPTLATFTTRYESETNQHNILTHHSELTNSECFNFDQLPAELLIYLSFFLDDMSLLCLSKVSNRLSTVYKIFFVQG
ncbi:unnamed protein product [Schistosoma mattheei]|uniref:F-box domain-containing protein n=1 Tax=Schistosoma mattheei TaxID=31246 RepID=A0AA85BS04_9TREM|nr:unnamed protein product [Schistosoma mattheei]